MEPDNNQLVHVSKSQEIFMKEFIQLYKDNVHLWDQNHPKYKKKQSRDEALQVLLDKTLEYYPEANADFVKTKIDNIRSGFRREYRKVKASRKSATSDEEIYVPSLWYFNQLLFLVGEEAAVEENKNDLSKNISIWTKEYTVALIELFKQHPVLCLPGSSSNKQKLLKAYADVTENLIKRVGKRFSVQEIRSKIQCLKQQFWREYRRMERNNDPYPKLWSYDLLIFLKEAIHASYRNMECRGEEEQMTTTDDEDNEHWSNDCGSEYDHKEHIPQDEIKDDLFDTIGKNVAVKLRDMSDDQRMYAENLINEVMYHGLMENLSNNWKLMKLGEI